MYEAPPTTIETYAALFPGEQLTMVLASIAAGNTAARLWLDDLSADAASTALLWDKGNNVFYLAGQPLEPEQHTTLRQVISDEIRPQALAEGRAYFRARAIDAEAHKLLPELFEGVALQDIVERFFGFDLPRPKQAQQPSLPDLAFVTIDRALLEREDLANVDMVRDEVRWMWGSEEAFYADGLGIAALLPDRVLCWCTAEYVSPQYCGIGIATDPEYRQHGIATATAARFVEECMRRGKRPFWECAASNPASARVAEKVGFEQLEETHFWVRSFGE